MPFYSKEWQPALDKVLESIEGSMEMTAEYSTGTFEIVVRGRDEDDCYRGLQERIDTINEYAGRDNLSADQFHLVLPLVTSF